MIQIGPSGPVRKADEAEWARARQKFAFYHHLRLPGFLEPSFLSQIQDQLRTACFVEKRHGDIATELTCFDSPAGDALLFLFNDPRLIQWIMDITAIAKVGCFIGRLYRMTPQSHHDTWHSDVGAFRLLAMSVNVCEEPHRGGDLLLRGANRPESEQRIQNLVPGDAVIFRVDPALEHRITNVEPGPPKTAWAGWFCSEPTFMDVLSGKVRL
jgi:hypothetical protein